MDLRQLRYFIAVAEELHFSRAAERLKISPPSLTQQIQALERHLGTRLFHRTKRSVLLTDVGAMLLDEARDTIRQAEHTELVGRLAGRGEIGHVEVGYITSAAFAGLLSYALKVSRDHQPGVEFRIHRQETSLLLKEIVSGDLDVAFVRPAEQYGAELSGFIVFSQPLVVALPTGHKLAAETVIEAALLRSERFISHSVETAFGFANYINAVAVAGHFNPRVERQTDMMSIITLVAAGLGIAVVPQSFQAMRIPGVTYRPFVPAQQASIALAFRSTERSPAVLAFIKKMRELAKSKTFLLEEAASPAPAPRG